MVQNNTYANVILPLPVRGFFTYFVPPELVEHCETGQRVVVQFGKKRLYTAIVHKLHHEKPTDYEVKPIVAVLDKVPTINKYQLRLWEWSADYYMCSMGDIYKAAMPGGLRLESETKIVPSPEQENAPPLTPDEEWMMSVIRRQETLTIGELGKLLNAVNPLEKVRGLIDKKCLLIQEEAKSKYRPKVKKTVRLGNTVNTEDKLLQVIAANSRAPKQQLLLRWFKNNMLTQVDRTELLEKTGTGSAVLRALIDKNILIEGEEEVSRLKDAVLEVNEKKALNQFQLKAYESLKIQFEKSDVVLLHGVTSSGKTELYIHLIEEQLALGKQVLYLLPEIALTSQIIQRLQFVFGSKVGVYHSKFSDAERVEIYQKLLNDDESCYQVILGVRSSIFLPFSRLGLIIVDEEHENTYKQFDPSPRYNARDLSVVLSKLHQAKVLLGTATPSLESYYNAQNGRYGLVELKQRHQNIQLPKIMIADVRKAYKKKQMRSHFTPMLLENMEQALNQNQQVILFQNRRGFSPYLECSSCGHIPKCKWCDVSLTYHKKINKQICHYCGYSIDNVYRCAHCQQPAMETKGFGTEKIEDEIALIFPEAKVARLDIDTSRGKHGHESIIRDFQNHKVDVLIGTQMVSKGLDFDHVSVVGIVNADNMLGFPDFRAYERSFQLMAQVSGRAGRKHKQGKVIIQTSDVENVIVKQVINNRYDLMFQHQLNERKTFFYPPFSRMIRLTLKHRDYQVVNSAGHQLAKSLKDINHVKILGPTAPTINKIQNQFIRQILIKMHKGNHIAQAKHLMLEKIAALHLEKPYKQVQVSVDVDPM